MLCYKINKNLKFPKNFDSPCTSEEKESAGETFLTSGIDAFVEL